MNDSKPTTNSSDNGSDECILSEDIIRQIEEDNEDIVSLDSSSDSEDLSSGNDVSNQQKSIQSNFGEKPQIQTNGDSVVKRFRKRKIIDSPDDRSSNIDSVDEDFYENVFSDVKES